MSTFRIHGIADAKGYADDAGTWVDVDLHDVDNGSGDPDSLMQLSAIEARMVAARLIAAADEADAAETTLQATTHEFERPRNTGPLVCCRCKLVPLTTNDYATPCTDGDSE